MKISAIITAVAGIPLFFLFGWLWNPHGDISSPALHILGTVGIYPFLAIYEVLGYGAAAFVAACVSQYTWFFLWVYLGRRLWMRFAALL